MIKINWLRQISLAFFLLPCVCIADNISVKVVSATWQYFSDVGAWYPIVIVQVTNNGAAPLENAALEGHFIDEKGIEKNDAYRSLSGLRENRVKEIEFLSSTGYRSSFLPGKKNASEKWKFDLILKKIGGPNKQLITGLPIDVN